MNKRRQIAKYIVADVISAALAWTIFFSFRKIYIEGFTTNDFKVFLDDTNYFLGLAIVPMFWVLLYAIGGYYDNIYRRSRIGEIGKTFLHTLIGTIILFFALILDDMLNSYRNFYTLVTVLFTGHFLLTLIPRL